MARLPFFPLYPDDFMSGTSLLTNEQVGLYFRLLCIQWSSGPLPPDIDQRPWVAEGIGRLWPFIADKFERLPDGRLANARLEAERAKASESRDRRAEAGRKGGSSVRSQRSIAQAMLQHCSSNASALLKHARMPMDLSSDSVSSCSSEGDARGGDWTAAAVAEYRNGSPSSRFALGRDALLVAVWGRIPKDWAKGRDANLVRLADAIQRVGEERKADREAAADWLIGRIAAYCGSAEGQGKYRRTLARWLDEAAWAEDDAAWIEREPPERPRQKVASW